MNRCRSLEDKLLIWKLNRGGQDALCRIYEKYRDDLVRIAAGLLNGVSPAEDIVQEVFLTLVRSVGSTEIKTSLKGYLTTCVVNRVRNSGRTKMTRETVRLEDVEPTASSIKSPDQGVLCDEEFQQLYRAMARLPYEQKEAVILHIQGQMKFREIAKLQNVSIKTALSRYRYGLNKLRSMLQDEAES